MPEMTQKCVDCMYFEPKDVIFSSPKWGLCIKFTKKIMGSDRESPFFRWEDDTCSNFKARNKSSDLHTRSNKT
jgi:hypothetical protein